MVAYPSPTGWKRKCSRCRVDRHDRCLGMYECGCDDPAHQAGLEGGIDVGDLPDETLVGLGIELGQYRQLERMAAGQDRTVEIVLRRALDHYLRCPRGGCAHDADEVGEEL